MKKTSLLLSTVILGVGLSGMAPFAVADSSSESTGVIEFEAADGAGKPSDPTDPAKENPNSPEATPETGPLILKVVPSFDFGSHKINQGGMELADTETRATYLEVRDNREYKEMGWTVKAHRTAFQTADQSKTLTGATLDLPAGSVRNSITNEVQGNAKTEDKISNGTITSSAAIIPENAADAVTVLKANALLGVGKMNTTANLIEKETVGDQRAKLRIAENTAQTGNFTSDITWTVTAGASS